MFAYSSAVNVIPHFFRICLSLAVFIQDFMLNPLLHIKFFCSLLPTPHITRKSLDPPLYVKTAPPTIIPIPSQYIKSEISKLSSANSAIRFSCACFNSSRGSHSFSCKDIISVSSILVNVKFVFTFSKAGLYRLA